MPSCCLQVTLPIGACFSHANCRAAALVYPIAGRLRCGSARIFARWSCETAGPADTVSRRHIEKSGTYVVSAEERALSCPKLTGSMQIIMSRLKDSPNRPKVTSTTTTMQAAAKPFFGGGSNLDVDEENRQSRARLKAYNDLLAEKKCKTLDIAGF